MGIQKDNPDLQMVGGFFTFKSYGIAVRKGDEMMLKAVNTALRKIRAAGEYNTIRSYAVETLILLFTMT